MSSYIVPQLHIMYHSSSRSAFAGEELAVLRLQDVTVITPDSAKTLVTGLK